MSKHEGRDKDKDKDRKHKRHRKDAKETKHKKEKKEKKEKKHHRDKNERKEKRSRHHHHHHNNDNDEKKAPEETISSEDYFRKSEEFRVWLRLHKHAPFDQLSAADARDKFEDFVKAWNKGRLPAMYYEGIPDSVRGTAIHTQFHWGFVDKLGDADRLQLESARDSVNVDTRTDKQSKTLSSRAHAAGGEADETTAPSRPSVQPRPRSPGRDTLEREAKADERRYVRKRERETYSVMLDEVAPKETGREALIDKRREKAARIHGAASSREQAIDGLDMPESQILGEDSNSFQAALQRQRQRAEAREAQRQQHALELQQKQREKEQAFFQQLGIDPAAGKKITIAPRPPHEG